MNLSNIYNLKTQQTLATLIEEATVLFSEFNTGFDEKQIIDMIKYRNDIIKLNDIEDKTTAVQADLITKRQTESDESHYIRMLSEGDVTAYMLMYVISSITEKYISDSRKRAVVTNDKHQYLKLIQLSIKKAA